MIENLKRIREPITWAVIAVVAANIVLGLVELGLRWSTGGLVPADFSDIGTSLMNVSLVLTVVVLVCTCFFITPATAHALLVTKVAAWVLTVGSLLTLVCWILGIAASANTLAIVLEFVGGFLDLVIKSLAAGSLWVLLRGVNAGRIDTRSAAVAEVPAAPPAKAPDAPTTWQRDAAAGAAWRTADEAATGAPGTARITEDPVAPPLEAGDAH